MSLKGLALVKEIVRLADEHKAQAITVLDLRGQEAPADFFVICSGEADTHVKAVYGAVEEGLRLHPEKTKALYVDGREDYSWLALDFFDVILHVFQPQKRLFYALERLWESARAYTLETLSQLEAPPPARRAPARKKKAVRPGPKKPVRKKRR